MNNITFDRFGIAELNWTNKDLIMQSADPRSATGATWDRLMEREAVRVITEMPVPECYTAINAMTAMLASHGERMQRQSEAFGREFSNECKKRVAKIISDNGLTKDRLAQEYAYGDVAYGDAGRSPVIAEVADAAISAYYTCGNAS